jgi:peptidyl-tRNA hydrolase, PTH1 family
MFLFAGLGNPGSQYSFNRHNAGYMAVDAIYRRHNLGPWQHRFQGSMASGEINRVRVFLLKPETLMNASGKSVQEMLHFYKLDADQLFVFHDEAEIPTGKIRIKRGGGDAGHKGLKSITELCGPYYTRIRIGVGRPPKEGPLDSHVLSNFSAIEFETIKTVCDAIAETIGFILNDKVDQLQTVIQLLLQIKHHSPNFRFSFDSND